MNLPFKAGLNFLTYKVRISIISVGGVCHFEHMFYVINIKESVGIMKTL